jgi:ankyrin repeat protein
VNTKTQTGSTPLHNAASNGHDACVALVLDAGCAVNARSHTGGPALVVAAAGGHAAVVSRLLAAGR